MAVENEIENRERKPGNGSDAQETGRKLFESTRFNPGDSLASTKLQSLTNVTDLSKLGFSRLDITNEKVKTDSFSDAQKKEGIVRLEKSLKEFVDGKPQPDSKHIRELQDRVKDFLENPDKKKAWKEFEKARDKIKVEMGKEGLEMLKEAEKEASKNPGRKEIEQDLRKKKDAFWDKVDGLPHDEKDRLMHSMHHRKGESTEERNHRVREELKDNKELLKKFNDMEDAEKRRKDSMNPREKELRQRHRELLEEQRILFKTARDVEKRKDQFV